MRWQLVAAFALVSTVAVPSVPAQSGPVMDAFESAGVKVDLVKDATLVITFRFDEGNFGDGSAMQSAYVRLRKVGEPNLDLAMQRNAGAWSTTLPVATQDLVAGAWTVDFYGVRPAGGGGLLASRPLEVTANDRVPPRLLLMTAASPILIGPGDSIGLVVSDLLLREVTFQFGGLPKPLPLAFPYALHGDILPDGATEVTFRASDRAGHVSTLVANIERDSFVPAIDLIMPEHAYLGGALDVQAVVREDGPFTLRLDANGTKDEVLVIGNSATSVNRTTTFTLIPLSGSNLTVFVEAIDRVGNRAIAAKEIALEAPIVDAKSVALMAETPAPLFVQKPVRLVATVEQVAGVATLPLTITIQAAGQSASFVANVGPGKTSTVTWEAKLPAGRYEVLSTVTAPASANETNPGNENATLRIEVFLGRLGVDGKDYDIRASDKGLPSAAVESGSARSYPLKIVDSGAGVAYQFTTSANQTYVWDPLKPVDDRNGDGNATTGSRSGSSTAAKGAPAPGLVMGLLVVAFAALVQRRKA